MLLPGDPIPDIHGIDQYGKPFHSHECIDKKNLVIFFYPKDFTPGCTAEACAFRDNLSQFTGYDAEIVGISGDDETSHKQFTEQFQLPYRLISDPDGKIREEFDIPKKFGFLSSRITFVFDKQGILRKRYSSQFFFSKHIEEALDSLRDINQ